MAPAPPHSSSAPFARDAHELRSVITAQKAETDALKGRLAHSQKECARLRVRLRDLEGELSVAAEATTSATDRLGAHANRHSLVLTAGVERSGAERVGVEHELQRVEALLHDRDQEIRKLRHYAHELEVTQHQQGQELKGLEVAHEATSSHARAVTEQVSSLMQEVEGLDGNPDMHAAAKKITEKEEQRLKETEDVLSSKRADHAELKQRAHGLTAHARNLEAEEGVLTERIREFEQSLRKKQDKLGLHDHRSSKESAQLREHCDQLRRALQSEQKDAVGVDQRALLNPQAGAEAEGVKREAAALVETVPRLMAMLRSQNGLVRSPEVPGDAIDSALHAFLRGCSPAAGHAVPHLVWRLSPGEYLFGGERVRIREAQGRLLLIRDAMGVTVPLADVVYQRVGSATVAPQSVDF